MNQKYFKKQHATKLLVLGLALQMGSLAGIAQSERARERANQNARFNRDRNAVGEDRREYNRPAMTDNQFMQRAYSQNLAEMKLAHVAVQASRDAEVQKAGHRIINEQQRANDALQKIAESKGVTLSKDLHRDDQETFDRVSKLQGAEFDRAYRDHLNTDYPRIIAMYRDAARNAQDEQLRNAASEYATMFEQHASTMGIRAGATSAGTVGSTTGTAAGTSEQRWDRRDGQYSWERDRRNVREREGATTTTPGATSAGTSASTLGALSKADEQVIERVFRQSQTQVRAAQLAVKNAQNANLKSLAQSIVSDHRQINQDLRDLASNRGVKLPTGSTDARDALLDSLERKSGADFDTAYREYVTNSHRNLTRLTESPNTTDSDVRTFLSRVNSTAQQHMTMLQRR